MHLQSLRDRLILSLIVIIAICTVTFTLIMASSTQTQSADLARERLAKDAFQLTATIENWITDNSRVIQALAQEQGGNVGDLSSIDFARRAGDFFNTYVGSEEGNFYIKPDTTMPADYDARQRGWYQTGLASDTPIISKPYIGKPSGYRMVTFAQSISVDGQRQGVAGASVLLSTISESILSDQYYKNGFATLVDNQGVIQIHRTEALLEKSINELIPSVNPAQLSSWAESREVRSLEVAGITHLVTLLPVANHDWYVLTGLDSAVVYANTRVLIMRFILLGIVTTLVLVIAGLVMIARLLKPLHRLNKTMENIAEGEADLTERLTEEGSTELKGLACSFNHFIERIQKTLQKARASSEQLTAVAEDARRDADNNRAKINVQLQEIQQVARAIDNMASTANQVAESARETANAAGLSADSSQKGMDFAEINQGNMSQLDEQVEQATTVIQKLDDHSQQINSILSTIQGIAEQTNLLALNAAIEAARAGDQGRGFAVVADEVRSLSQRTHEATEEIQKMILTLQDYSKSAVNIMDKGRELAKSTNSNTSEVTTQLKSIHCAIQSISDMSEAIAKASAEQRQAAESINSLTGTINSAAESLSETGASALKRVNALDELGHSIYNDLKIFKL
jgi:methyl-accepting chemotaxis protein